MRKDLIDFFDKVKLIKRRNGDKKAIILWQIKNQLGQSVKYTVGWLAIFHRLIAGIKEKLKSLKIGKILK